MENMNNERRLHTGAIIAAICVAFTLGIIGIFCGMNYYNGINEKKNVAMQRVDTLYDQLTEYDPYTPEESSITEANRMLNEIKILIDTNDLDETYSEKYEYACTYIDDVKIYTKIYDAVYITRDSIDEIQQNINSLETDKVRACIDKYMLTEIEELIKTVIIHNSLQEIERYVRDNNMGDGFIKEVYYYNLSGYIGDSSLILNMDEQDLVFNIPIRGYTSALNDSYSNYYTDIRTMLAKSVDDLAEGNANCGFMVSYEDGEGRGQLDWCETNFDAYVMYYDGSFTVTTFIGNHKSEFNMKDIYNKSAIRLA